MSDRSNVQPWRHHTRKDDGYLNDDEWYNDYPHRPHQHGGIGPNPPNPFNPRHQPVSGYGSHHTAMTMPPLPAVGPTSDQVYCRPCKQWHFGACPFAPLPPPALSTVHSQNEDNDDDDVTSRSSFAGKRKAPITITTGDQTTVIENFDGPLALNIPQTKPAPQLTFSEVQGVGIEPVEAAATTPPNLSISAISSVDIKPEEAQMSTYTSVGVETDEPGFGMPGRSLTGEFSLIDLDDEESKE